MVVLLSRLEKFKSFVVGLFKSSNLSSQRIDLQGQVWHDELVQSLHLIQVVARLRCLYLGLLQKSLSSPFHVEVHDLETVIDLLHFFLKDLLVLLSLLESFFLGLDNLMVVVDVL